MKKPLIVIAGPTASGKTALSINLSKVIGSEIISADSMQVYKYMNIGTAKPTKEEKENIPHYMIDIKNPDEEFSVAEYKNLAKSYVDSIHKNNHIPLIVGGTGFYIQALVNNINFMETNVDYTLRNSLESEAKLYGNEYVHNKLKEIDSISFDSIHPNNLKRVIRAIEYYHTTNEPISIHNQRESTKESIYNTTFFVLYMNRDTLYNRIDKRVDIMIESGLVDEVKSLLDMGYSEDLVSMQGLGYKEIVPYIKGNISLDECIYILKRDTRHYAKRQITWFKREKNTICIDVDKYDFDTNKILNIIIKHIENNGIL